MNVNRELLDKMAHLARLEFDEKNAKIMLQDMTAIVRWIEKLNEVNTEGIEPLTTMSHEINSFREDKIHADLNHQNVLKNAPKKDENFFRVPKVIE